MTGNHFIRGAQSLWWKHGILIIIPASFAIRFYNLGVRTFHGDELGSLSDAGDLMKNLHALAYFLLLRLWMLDGSSEFWLRSLSALLLVLAVAVLYRAVWRFGNRRTALLAGTLFATSPFAEVYAQQVRFYSLFLLTTCLSLWAFSVCLATPTRLSWVSLGLNNLVLLLSHLMSTLFLVSETVALFLLARRFSRSQKVAGLGLLGGGLALVGVPQVREIGFNAMASFVSDPTRYSVPRGLSIVQIAKVPLNFFFFTFGESVYPLNYALVIPGVLAYGAALIAGVWGLRSFPRLGLLVGIATGFSMVILYFILDALIPSEFAGASPRYIIFLLPLILIVAAMGLEGTTNTWLIVPLLAVNVGSLVSYWNGNWAYTDDLIDWREVTLFAGSQLAPNTAFILDGRANDIAKEYFPSSWQRETAWEYQDPGAADGLSKFQRLVIISDDFRLSHYAQTSELLHQLEASFDISAVWSQYPVFIYVLDRDQKPLDVRRVDPTTGLLDLPVEIYGLEFQDLKLPIPVAADAGRSLELRGAIALPSFDQRTVRIIHLDHEVEATKIAFWSNLTDAAKIPPGTVVAYLTVEDRNSGSRTIPIRAGYETSAWNRACLPRACTSAFRWTKRFALLGDERYPESWEEFDASIFTIELPLDRPTQVSTLELERLPGAGTLYVWGIAIEP